MNEYQLFPGNPLISVKIYLTHPERVCHYKPGSVREMFFLTEPPKLRQRSLIALVTAYLDESGTHGGATITVMGGFAGTDSQWLIFEEKWDALKNEYLELQGVPIHATDLLRFKKQYSRWTEAKQLDFVVKACQIVADSGVYGMVASVDTTSYSRHLKAVDGIRMNIDTAYGTCFRQIMVETCKHVRAVYPEWTQAPWRC